MNSSISTLAPPAQDLLPLTIGGAAVRGSNFFDVINPATGATLGRAPDATKEQLDAAVAAAKSAFDSWGGRPWGERREILLTFCDRIEANAETLAELVAQEVGKPLAKAKMEVNSGLFFARGFSTLELKNEVLRDTAG